MCAFCTLFSAEGHWSEAPTDAASAGEPVSPRDRRLERTRRVAILNRILDYYGCAIEDWAASKYIVRSRRGQAELIDSLPQVWAAVEKIAQRPVDPLEQALIEKLLQSPSRHGGR